RGWPLCRAHPQERAEPQLSPHSRRLLLSQARERQADRCEGEGIPSLHPEPGRPGRRSAGRQISAAHGRGRARATAETRSRYSMNPPRRRALIVLAVVAIVIGASWLWWLSRVKTGEGAERKAQAAVPVVTAKVERRDVP